MLSPSPSRPGFLAVMFWSLAGGVMAAEPDPAAEPRVAHLVRQLGASSFRDRAAAEESLSELGEASRDALESALSSGDPEVRLRAERLLKHLKIASLWSASRVRLSGGSCHASELFEELEKQSGNAISLGDQYGTIQDAPVELAAKERDFWPTFDELCRRSGNRPRAHYGPQSGLVLVAGQPGHQPVAYAGPIRGQINSAQRRFSEELTYADGESEVVHSFDLTFSLTWEQRLRVVAYRGGVILVGAVTDDGQKLTLTSQPERSWKVVDEPARQVSTALSLSPPATSAKKLETLAVSWELVALGDMATLQIEKPHTDSSKRKDDLRVRVERLEQISTARWELVVEVRRELPLPEPEEVLFHENEIELLDENGAPFRLESQTGLQITEGVARSKLIVVGPTASAEPTRLRVTYPRIRDRREVVIIFRDIPLPVAVPG